MRSASRIAERFAEGHLSERMPVRGEDDMARLAVSFNDMAESLQRQITTREFGNLQRRFTSDVSHELRTPLDHGPDGRRPDLRPRRGSRPGVAPLHRTAGQRTRPVRGTAQRPAGDLSGTTPASPNCRSRRSTCGPRSTAHWTMWATWPTRPPSNFRSTCLTTRSSPRSTPPGRTHPAQPHRQRHRPRRAPAGADQDGRRRGHRRGHRPRLRGAMRPAREIGNSRFFRPTCPPAVLPGRAPPDRRSASRPGCTRPAGAGANRQGGQPGRTLPAGARPRSLPACCRSNPLVSENHDDQVRQAPAKETAGSGCVHRRLWNCQLAGPPYAGCLSCAGVPDSSPPQAIGTVAPPAPSSQAGAQPRHEPDQLLREFLKATADPANPASGGPAVHRVGIQGLGRSAAPC